MRGLAFTAVKPGIGVIAVALVMTLAAPCLATSAKKPKEFALGIKAQDEEKWGDSIKLLNSAVLQQKEDGAPVRIYGLRFEDYLPHYYLGLAYYQKNDCKKALEEWEKSLSAEFVKSTAKYGTLIRYRLECQKRTRPVEGQPPNPSPARPPEASGQSSR